jgi:hypothetical protein
LVAQRPCRHRLAGKGEELGRQIGDAFALPIGIEVALGGQRLGLGEFLLQGC